MLACSVPHRTAGLSAVWVLQEGNRTNIMQCIILPLCVEYAVGSMLADGSTVQNNNSCMTIKILYFTALQSSTHSFQADIMLFTTMTCNTHAFIMNGD